MPELPEVETTRQGINPFLVGQTIKSIVVRNAQFRVPVPLSINDVCRGLQIKAVLRRAKYLLIQLSQGYLLIHLGMSGHLRMVQENSAANKHDHIDLLLENGSALRFCDPRRFGLFLYLDENPHQHPLLSHLGPEPLSDDFSGDYFFRRLRNKNQPIKSVIMNNEIVVGVGNIYATESLFLAGIHPSSPAKNLSLDQAKSLSNEIKFILEQAITAGGTTLRDFSSDGKPGYFSFSLQVYGKKGQPCIKCQTIVEAMIIGGRNSSFCPVCQPLI